MTGKRTKTRDYTTYRYITFGVKRGSTLEQALLADVKNYAKLTLGPLSAMRLEQFYQGVSHQEAVSPPKEQERIPEYLVDIIEDIDAADEAWPK